MQPLILLLALLCFIVPSFCFHVTRNTEIGLCTVTDDKNHPHKFSCLQGDRNYCCGDRYNQTCCSVDEFASQHKTSLILITVSLVLVSLLFVAVVVLSLATVLVSLKVRKKKKERNKQ